MHHKNKLGWSAALLLCADAGAAQWNGPQPNRIFDKLDENGDAVIDARELEAARRSTFEHADADRDGFVAEAEAQDLFDGLRASGGAGQRPLLRSRLVSRRPAEQANLLARFDTNGDGKVGEAEFLVGAHPFVTRFDANADGRLTRAEVEKEQAVLSDEIKQRRVR